jgi:hypothetical protein
MVPYVLSVYPSDGMKDDYTKHPITFTIGRPFSSLGSLHIFLIYDCCVSGASKGNENAPRH